MNIRKLIPSSLLAFFIFLLLSLTAAAATIVLVNGDTAAGENQPGWLFNRDTDTSTPYEFNSDAASIGNGSLYVLPIGSNAADKFIGENFVNAPIADVNSISYDFRIGSGGSASDANHFYMNVYANYGESDDLKYYDCRYDVVPPTGSTSGFTTVTFDPTQAYPVATRSSSPYTCPAVPADMDSQSAGSNIRMFALNVGDTSTNDVGLDGYLDNVVVDLDSGVTIYDFEPEMQGPTTSSVEANPNPIAVSATGTVTAYVDDSNTGGSNIESAEYRLDGGTWMPMNADDGSFDEVSEDVSAGFTAPDEAGIYDLCVRGTDGYGNLGAEECVMLVVYDPDGGFVTGGGWIDSPAGAMPPIVTTTTISGISGDTSTDPDATYAPYMLRHVGNPPPSGYDPLHDYQWASPAILTPSPEDGPVTLSGSIDVGGQVVGQVAMIGLLDRDDLAAGNSSFQRGAYIYVYRNSDTTWKIGPSDGNAGGEIIQTSVTISDTDLPSDGVLLVDFTLDGTVDGTTCASGPVTAPAGCMTLQITGGTVNATLTDSYGDGVGGSSASPEFANGAVPGWDDYLGSNVAYTLSVPNVTGGSPEGRASFGFVAKYKKGADVPMGNTEFVFKAGDLNFRSTSYDWLVVTGSDTAKFKGEGTINGNNSPTGELYKFQIWAQDANPDTFRIKIWYEENGSETVVYDNGMDQSIGGGNIVVHNK